MQRDIVKDRTFLARKSAPATADDAAVIADLRDTLAAHHDDCVGMAGNMIGSLTRIIIVTMGEKDVIMVNPVIIKRSGMYLTKEGCLSLEGVTRVKRYENITVAWQAADGAEALARLDEMDADVLLLDIRMTGMDGLATLEALGAIRRLDDGTFSVRQSVLGAAMNLRDTNVPAEDVRRLAGVVDKHIDALANEVTDVVFSRIREADDPNVYLARIAKVVPNLRPLAAQMMADRFTAAISQAVQERVAELEIPAK